MVGDAASLRAVTYIAMDRKSDRKCVPKLLVAANVLTPRNRIAAEQCTAAYKPTPRYPEFGAMVSKPSDGKEASQAATH